MDSARGNENGGVLPAGVLSEPDYGQEQEDLSTSSQLQIQHKPHARLDALQQRRRQTADALGQERFVCRDQLRYIGTQSLGRPA